MKILITGAAGFIGFFLANMFAGKNHSVTGIDNLNDAYNSSLKSGRLKESGFQTDNIKYGTKIRSTKYHDYNFIKLDITDKEGLEELFIREKFDFICHLAARAGIRNSLKDPFSYADSNIMGFLNILELSKTFDIKHLCYASSSSIYGLSEQVPYSESNNTDHPISIYSVTKKSNELMAHTYSHLYNLPTTGLRFFTVYGPWGRPDMVYFKFVKNILEGRAIDIYNNGEQKRDFTYIDDIITMIGKILFMPPGGNPEWSGKNPETDSSVAPYKIYNIGNNSPVHLMDFINIIEAELGVTAVKNFLPKQPGDVKTTWADVSSLGKDFNYKPGTKIKEGIRKFVGWYKLYYLT